MNSRGNRKGGQETRRVILEMIAKNAKDKGGKWVIK